MALNVDRVGYEAGELRRRTVMIPRTWNVFIEYERITGNSGHVSANMFYTVSTLIGFNVFITLLMLSVLLSNSFTAEFYSFPNLENRSVVLSYGTASG